ncbi:unnamed protein product [Cyclocybe aegerita]|uniref:Uncharacterized protein n=1 Tax=Cyclocybe aegerita TaxID=1973307 RepID=A0A8S0X5T1_CYCAE|nr:unnamed protein product [Cyclocybe aegerita]
MTGGELSSLINEETSIKVSSTLEKANGKRNLIDGSPETCWTSQQSFRNIQGLPQFIQLGFTNRVIPKRVSITFQGGFVGTRCAICIPTDESGKKDWRPFTTIFPEDVNRRQMFELVPSQPDLLTEGVIALKLVFEESSDFFGRITVYDVAVEGSSARF